jgi:hypothetical protein
MRYAGPRMLRNPHIELVLTAPGNHVDIIFGEASVRMKPLEATVNSCVTIYRLPEMICTAPLFQACLYSAQTFMLDKGRQHCFGSCLATAGGPYLAFQPSKNAKVWTAIPLGSIVPRISGWLRTRFIAGFGRVAESKSIQFATHMLMNVTLL